jgi:FimV-like protein
MIINDTELARLVDVGLAAAHLGDTVHARTLFENLLRYKDHAPARIGLALTYLSTNDFTQAETLLNEVLAKNPEDAEAQALLGLTLSFAGRIDDAAAIFERVPKGSSAGKLVEALAAVNT